MVVGDKLKNSDSENVVLSLKFWLLFSAKWWEKFEIDFNVAPFQCCRIIGNSSQEAAQNVLLKYNFF